MVILAAAIIISLDNAGVINKANDAVGKTNLKQVQQIASLAWAEAYADDKRSESELKAAVDKALEDNKIDTSKYDVDVTENGVEVTEKTEGNQGGATQTGWRIEREKDENDLITKAVVTDGTVSYEIGTTVNYMPEGVGDTTYKGGWKLLGVDDEGRLLIMSNDSITGSNVTLSGEDGFLNGLSTLQNTVNSYKDGTIGVAVRSVTADDIDAVAGYDPDTFTGAKYLEEMVAMYKSMGMMTGTDAEIKAQLLSDFGFESESEMALLDNGLSVTYSWDGTGFPKYTYLGLAEPGNLLNSHKEGFTYYDKATNSFKTVAYTTTVGDIVTIENDFPAYLGNGQFAETSKAYKMLFLTADESTTASYWLASRCVRATPDCVIFGMHGVGDGLLGGYALVDSGGGTHSPEDAARAVVTLASGVQLADSETVAGTYDISLTK